MKKRVELSREDCRQLTSISRDLHKLKVKKQAIEKAIIAKRANCKAGDVAKLQSGDVVVVITVGVAAEMLMVYVRRVRSGRMLRTRSWIPAMRVVEVLSGMTVDWSQERVYWPLKV